jgi:hypothetical protein
MKMSEVPQISPQLAQFQNILHPIAELLARKNTDYGDSYVKLREQYGPVGFYIRIADKMGRIEQLDKAGALVKEESIEDSISDIIGYCTLELKYRKEKNKNDNS